MAAATKKRAKKAPAKKKAAPRKRAAAKKAPEEVVPIHVDDNTRRSDLDVRNGHFCRVTKGEHEGRYGVFTAVSELEKDGWPKRVIITTRDAEKVNLVVDYDAIEPAESGGI